MLLYERNIWKEINQPKEIIRFWLSYMRQKRSFRKSEGVIFISKYAYSVVSEQLNLTGKKIAIIHHGVSDRFKMKVKKQNPIESYSAENPYRLLYVSTVHVYKHQWNVVTAVGNLRKKGYPLELNLVGGIIYKPAGDRLLKTIRQVDPDGRFVHYCNHISYENIEEYYQNTEGVIFASTCENMPNILIESMSSGRPIACSDKQPMPEFLKEDDFRFNSYEIASIENAVEKMILDPELREISATNNLDESIKYSWEKTTQETFQFIKKIYTDYHNNPQNPDCRLS
ncbi:MAG: glycosyltransferase [Bacteroidota bacterium]